MEKKMERLEGMIGNTYRYEGRRVTIEDVKIKGNIATLVVVDGENIQLSLDELLEEDLSEFKLIKENGLMKNPHLVDAVLQNASMYDKLQSTLLDTIEKIQKDKEYIPQAEAINNTLGKMIDLEKVRVTTLALLK